MVKANSMPEKILKSQQLKNFLSAIHNEYTQTTYMATLGQFITYAKAESPRDLFGPTLKIEKRIQGWIGSMKLEGLKGTTIRMRFNVVKLFYEMNRTVLAWSIISKTIPKSKATKDVAWTRKQLQEMLTAAREREQAIIPLLASSGMRKGVLPNLTIGDFIPRNEWGIFEIICYRGEEEEYRTYCSPEARKAIERYWNFRELHGETPTPKSPAFRQEWNLEDREAAKIPLRLTDRTVTSAMMQIVIKTGLRKTIKSPNQSSASSVRHEQKLLHGIRKFFETTLLDLGFDDKWVDMIEGHKMVGMRENYYRPKDDAVLVGMSSSDGKFRKPGYVDLMRELVINDEERSKIKIKELEKKIMGEEQIMKEIESLKRRNKRLEGILDPRLRKATKEFSLEEPLAGKFGKPEKAVETNDDYLDSR